jgi:hypothetical protein
MQRHVFTDYRYVNRTVEADRCSRLQLRFDFGLFLFPSCFCDAVLTANLLKMIMLQLIGPIYVSLSNVCLFDFCTMGRGESFRNFLYR